MFVRIGLCYLLMISATIIIFIQILFTFQDLAILSDNITKCEKDIKESQNTKPKSQCISPFNEKVDHLLPITEAGFDVSIKETTAATVEAIPFKSLFLLCDP